MEKLKYPRKYVIEDLQLFAKNKEGLCLSEKYYKASTVYKWQCKFEHIWETNWNNIKNHNRWCKFCAWNELKIPKKWNIEYLQKFALEKNGKCLSEIYDSYNSRFLWQCEKEHIWKATWNNILNGSWCPLCNKGSKGEELIDKILSKQWNLIIDKDYYREFSFINCRYDRPLYFDFYIPKYNLIIEYDGQQHFIEKPNFWQNDLTLKERIMRDKIKDNFCSEYKINIIRLPYNVYSKIEKILNQEFKNGFNRTLNLSLDKRNKICV